MAGGESSAELEAKLATIQGLADRIQNCQWSFETTHHLLRSADELDSVVGTKPEFVRGHVIVEGSGRRYRVELEKVGRWFQGVTPYIGKDLRFSFDGCVSLTRERIHHGAELPGPTDRPGFGEVKNQPDNSLHLLGLEIGQAYLPPFVWSQEGRVQRLPDVLRPKLGKGLLISTSDDAHDQWDITFEEMVGGCCEGDSSGSSSSSCCCDPSLDLVRLRYVLAAGGAVSEATWSNGSPPQVWRRIVTESHHRNADGFWMPDQVSMIDRFDKYLMRTRFSDVRVNEPMNDDTFHISFPAGTTVDDEIKQVRYVVGQMPEDDEAAVQRFCERNMPVSRQTNPGGE
jgi:hypothetical protein